MVMGACCMKALNRASVARKAWVRVEISSSRSRSRLRKAIWSPH